MAYLEYHVETKQVVQIHEEEPVVSNGYDFAKSHEYKPGDEYELTIWVNSVDEEKNLTSESAIRNNVRLKDLLKENAQLKNDLGALVIENATDKARIAELESSNGAMLLEIASLKMGVFI